MLNQFFSRRQAWDQGNNNVRSQPVSGQTFLGYLMVRAYGPVLQLALPHPDFCFISQWSHNAGLTVYWHREPVSHKFNRMTLLQCDWLENVPSSENFFSSKWTCLFLQQHGVQALCLFDVGFYDIPGAQGRAHNIQICLMKWHVFFPLPLLFPFCRLLYLKQTVPAQ